ncbi:MAG: metallophosphoesterase [Sandaracinaceae bacterium]
MRVVDIDPEPCLQVPYLNAARRGGVDSCLLPVHLARVDALPACLDALVVTGDLQGVVPSHMGAESLLLGEALAIELLELDALAQPARVGVLLAGDLYSAPGGDVRGASGDVTGVWEAFAELYRWVAGVAGNHDRFGAEKDARRLYARPGVHRLDDRALELDGLRLGGVDHIIGNPDKPGRRDAFDFLDTLALVLAEDVDLLVLHEGPSGGPSQRGNDAIRSHLERAASGPLTICGHTHWDAPLAELDGGRQVLNVDARAVILQAQ